ncbi:MAG: hypothetical protein V1793_25080 [Pseudomonadota bacterium]
MITNHNLTNFQYGGIDLKEAVFITGMPYFTRKAIGEWLGYKKPQEAVDKIIDRNPHIENPEWSTTVKLAVTQPTGKNEHTPQTGVYAREVEIKVYHPIALQLIVFESRQPRAIEYKIAVARLVSDIITGKYLWNVFNMLRGAAK